MLGNTLIAALAMSQAALPAPPSPPPPQAQTGPSGPRLRNSPHSLISEADYPSSALRAEEEGRVSVILSVGITGRAGGCFIRESSGSERLDVEACRVLMRRARYLPAIDASGNATLGEHHHGVTWRLPDPEPTIDASGKLIAAASRPPTPSGPVQPNPVSLTDLSALPNALPVPAGYPGPILNTQMMRLTVGTDGRVQSCQPIDTINPALPPVACDVFTAARFAPATAPDGQTVASTLYVQTYFLSPRPPIPSPQ